MFNVIENNNKLEMQMGKLSKRKCIYNRIGKCLYIILVIKSLSVIDRLVEMPHFIVIQ